MTVLSIRSSDNAALSVAFTLHQAVTWTSIAPADSDRDATALNNHGGYSVCKK